MLKLKECTKPQAILRCCKQCVQGMNVFKDKLVTRWVGYRLYLVKVLLLNGQHGKQTHGGWSGLVGGSDMWQVLIDVTSREHSQKFHLASTASNHDPGWEIICR